MQLEDQMGEAYARSQVAHAMLIGDRQVEQQGRGPVNGRRAESQEEVYPEDAVALVDDVEEDEDAIEGTHLPGQQPDDHSGGGGHHGHQAGKKKPPVGGIEAEEDG